MKKQKTAAIGKDIVDAVFANTINAEEISNDDNVETRAQVVEKDDEVPQFIEKKIKSA